MSNYLKQEISRSMQVLQAMLDDSALSDTVVRLSAACTKSIASGGKVMFCGNGGSAGDSQHLAAELVGKLVFDRPAMAGLALTVDSSALTAVGNDFGYEYVFSRQVEGLGRAGDVLVGISTSGRSKNVVKAMEAARERGIVTVAMTGSVHGPMAELADFWLPIPATETQKIQEGQMVIGHIFCALIEEAIHGKQKAA